MIYVIVLISIYIQSKVARLIWILLKLIDITEHRVISPSNVNIMRVNWKHSTSIKWSSNHWWSKLDRFSKVSELWFGKSRPTLSENEINKSKYQTYDCNIITCQSEIKVLRHHRSKYWTTYLSYSKEAIKNSWGKIV